jgi:short-subunit dehydrogenase
VNALRPVTVITGASSGIGAALARVFARHGHELVLVARRQDKLAALAAEIVRSGRPESLVLPLDLGQWGASGQIGEALAARGLAPQFIVNNAAFGLLGKAAALDRDEQLAMIDLNVRALTDLSLAFIDSLARHRGGILNVASVAAFLPGPGMAVYYATKGYVLSFSDALHYELRKQGIRVTVLCPGPVKTEFQARSGIPEANLPRMLVQPAESVAEAGYRGLMLGRRCVVPGFFNKVVTFLPRLLPRRLLLAAIDAGQNRRRASATPVT